MKKFYITILFFINSLIVTHKAQSNTLATREDVISCYHFILGREPENEDVVDDYLSYGFKTKELRDVFFKSSEFQNAFLEKHKSDILSDPLFVRKLVNYTLSHQPLLYPLSAASEDIGIPQSASEESDPYHFENAPSGNIFHTPIYEGQPIGISDFVLQIQADQSHFLFECLMWHYALGIRRFNIINQAKDLDVQTITARFKKLSTKTAIVLFNCPLRSLNDVYSDTHYQLTLNASQFLCLNNHLNFLTETIKHFKSNMLIPILNYGFIESEETPPENIPFYEKNQYRQQNSNYRLIPLKATQHSYHQYILTQDAFIADFSSPMLISDEENPVIHQPLNVSKALLDSVLYINQDSRDTHVTKSNHMRQYNDYITRFGTGEVLFSDTSSFIFGQVAKCGTTTLTHFLLTMMTEYKTHDNIQYRRKILKESCLFMNDFISTLLDEKTFKFSVVRNPFIRVLSGYFDRIIKERDQLVYESFGLSQEEPLINFKDFLKCIQQQYQINMKTINVHFRPQWALNLSEIIPYNFIGKLENFYEDFFYIIRRIGAPGTPETYNLAPHATNAAERLAAYYDAESINIVREIYEKDFTLYQYSTDLPTDTRSAAGQRLFSILDRDQIEGYAIPSVYDM